MTNAPTIDTASAPTRSPGETTGTFLRPQQHLAEAFAAFDIREEVDVLMEEARYLPDRRSSKTLVKLPELRIILTAACAGTSTGQHHTHAPVSVQCLSGLIQINAGDSQVELDQAGLATFGADLEHRVTAVTDAAFLTTVAWTAAALERPKGRRSTVADRVR